MFAHLEVFQLFFLFPHKAGHTVDIDSSVKTTFFLQLTMISMLTLSG